MIKIEANRNKCKVTAHGTPAEIMAELQASALSILDDIVEGCPTDDKEEFRKFILKMYLEIMTETIDEMIEGKL